MRAASAQWRSRARGAHALPYHGPLQLLLAEDLVVLGVSTNPEPRDAASNIDSQRAIVKAHAGDPILAHLL